MATKTITTRLALDGEAEYKAALKNINAELSLYKSELDKVTAKHKEDANSLDALRDKEAALKGQMDALNQKYSAQAEMLQKARDAQSRFAAQAEELRAKLAELKNSSGDTAAEEKKLAEEIGKAEANMQKAANSVTFYQKQLNYTERDQSKLGDELKRTKQYLNEAENSADNCATSIDKYGKEVKEAGASSQEFADGAQKSGQGIEQLATALAAAGIAKTAKEIADELLACAGAAAGFETALAKLSTLVDTSVYPMADIKEQLVELSNETGVAVGALAEAAYQARSAGVDSADVISFVSTATKTSVAGFTDSATAVDVLTTALNAYKLEGSEAERVASMLVKTQDKGKTSVGQLAQNMGRVIPIAAAYNVSLENLTTSYALLTKSGTNTAIATTNLSAMLNELAKDGSTVADILQEQTGKSFAQLMEGGMNLGQVMEILADSVDGDTTAFSNLWSSSTAGQSALSLLNSGAEEYNRTLEVMETSSGAVDRNFQIMADTTEMAQQRMTNAADNLRIAIGDQLNPALEELYSTGADAFTWATDFVEQNPWLVQAIAGAVGALALLAAGIAAYTAVTAAAKAAQDALNLSMGLCPLVAVTAAVGALAFAIGGYVASLDDADDDTREFTEALRESKEAYEDLVNTMSERQGDLENTAATLKRLLGEDNKTDAQKNAITQYVDELNEALPELALAYDGVTDSINMEVEAIDDMLARQEAQEEYNAQQERLTELYAERTEIDERLEQAEAALADAQSENREELASYFDIAADYNSSLHESSGNTGLLADNVRELTAAQEANEAEIAALEEATSAYAQQQAEADQTTGAMTFRVDELITRMTELEASYKESYDAAYASIESQLGLFNKLDGEAKTTIDDLIGTLQGQVEYMDTYAANIQKAMEMGVDQGLIQKLSDGSEESAQILAAIVQGGEEDIAALNEQFAKVEEGKENFSDTVAQMETEFDKKMREVVGDLEQAAKDMDVYDKTFQAGVNDIKGLIDGADSMKADLAAKFVELANAALAAYKTTVDQHSPSKKFEQAGRFDIQGLINGVEKEKPAAVAAYEAVAKAAKNVMSGLNDWIAGMEHDMLLRQKNGVDTMQATVDSYRAMQEAVHQAAAWYRSQGYAETSDEIQKLQKLWWGYADDIADVYEAVRKAITTNASAMLDDFINDTGHALFLAEKHGTGTAEATVAAYMEIQQKLHETAETYRAQGYSETSDEIQKLQKLWWGYADDIADVQKTVRKTITTNASAMLDDFIHDTEHTLFLAEKNGTDTVKATVAAYREIQQKLHETAEIYRAQGYSETSDEIQKLQKLWFGYADSIAREQANAAKAMIDGIKAQYDSLSGMIGLKSDASNLAYQLWERTEGKNASEAEKYAKKLALLTEQQEDQNSIVAEAEAAYKAVVEQYGAASEESYQYQKQLLQEKLALQDLLDEIKQVTNAQKELDRQKIRMQIQMNWATSGLGRAEAAAKDNGYTTPYEVSKISGSKLAGTGGETFSAAYADAAQAALTAAATHLPSTLDAPRTADTLGRQMEAMTAGVVNAVSDIARSVNAGTERIRLLTVDGKVLAEASFDDFADYGDANGTPILNSRR